jgi:hypothetical protein
MSLPPTGPQVLDFFGTPLVIEPSPGQLSSDAGLLPIRQLDQRIGLTLAFTAALDDPRDPDLTDHTFREMVRARVYGILAGGGKGGGGKGDADHFKSIIILK